MGKNQLIIDIFSEEITNKTSLIEDFSYNGEFVEININDDVESVQIKESSKFQYTEIFSNYTEKFIARIFSCFK